MELQFVHVLLLEWRSAPCAVEGWIVTAVVGWKVSLLIGFMKKDVSCWLGVWLGTLSINKLPTFVHWLLFIQKYWSLLHISSLKCSSSGGYRCTHAANGTVTLYESSWWLV